MTFRRPAGASDSLFPECLCRLLTLEKENPCQVNGTELELSVTFSDGTVLTPACSAEVWSQRVGWIAWEFEQPIDPEDAVSVTLNGRTIPLDNS